MNTLERLVLSYSAYHRDPRNTFTHFFGVPLVVFALFIPLGWFRFIHAEDGVTFAFVFFCVMTIWYLKVDLVVGLIVAPLSWGLLYAADQISRLPFRESTLWFAASFVLGWMIQLLGHYFEGRKPALVDNLSQVFNAPIFLAVELLFLLGRRKGLKAKVDALPFNRAR